MLRRLNAVNIGEIVEEMTIVEIQSACAWFHMIVETDRHVAQPIWRVSSQMARFGGIRGPPNTNN